MKENSIYKNLYIRKLNEAIEDADNAIKTDGEAFSEPEVKDMPPAPEDADAGIGGDVGESDGGRAFDDLRSYIDTLPQDGEISNQQIIDLGKKYADYFREVKDTIKDLQEKQLSNAFEDCLNVKFLPLSKALSNMIDELDAGVADKVHEKNSKAEREAEGGI